MNFSVGVEAADDSVSTRVAATRKFKFRDFRWPSVAWFAYPCPNLGCWPFHSHYHFSLFTGFQLLKLLRPVHRLPMRPRISQRSRGKPRKLVKLHQKKPATHQQDEIIHHQPLSHQIGISPSVGFYRHSSHKICLLKRTREKQKRRADTGQNG